MDKITRVLMLYSILLSGEKVDKFSFCVETDCQPRSFDRDVEDVRLFLSESFSGKELLYDRSDNSYYLSGSHRVEMETFEYKIIERILLDSKSLRKDELKNLLERLASNSEKTALLNKETAVQMETYPEPAHGKSLMKIHGDLSVAIKNKMVVRIKYISDDTCNEIELLPYCITNQDGYFYLTGFSVLKTNKTEELYRLDKINSFEIMRKQTFNEEKQIKDYFINSQKRR